jgi:hypothetical protein
MDRKLCYQFTAARNNKPQLLTDAFVHKVRDIEQYCVDYSQIFADKYGDKHPQQWMKEALITLEEATEAYMVEVIGKSHF